jgi:hypothetical protein
MARRAVGSNQYKTRAGSPDALWRHIIQHHKEVNARLVLADNPSTPSDILVDLLHDEHPPVAQMVLANPGLPEEYRILHQAAN